MEARPVIFFTVQALACIYAARRGGQPERIVAAAMAIAAIATAFPSHNPLTSYRMIEWRGVIADVFLLAVLVGVVCAANRFWPIWMTAVHLDALAIHAARFLDPVLLPSVYKAGTGWAAYPMIAMLVIGTARHKRRAADGHGVDWSPNVLVTIWSILFLRKGRL